ncbi:DUF2147 domain-containing protein [Rhodopseudomonas sp. P2A-2r]|uniref:DUF2147 domain-containing protein n=1 Tax=unclassified Rhodopseudomonas TaxID=2638247 RepID=UPI002234321D|nr:DUF2147 domain-containing protein [Rhodopseudomonas sp. P2A-2r]UZE47704.1 DUF2147 domain-containing protein [Rhodopseudomonas sp. P2A-2r]
MRHSIYCGILFSAGLVSAGLTPAHATDPTGDWQVEDGVANIRVAECNGSMWGAVSWEKRVGGIDKNNPDVSKRNRPTLGMVTLIDMKKNPKADEWKGKVYDAKDSGKLYDATIRPKGPDELEIEGCLVWPLCGSQTWTRVSPPIPSSPTNPPKGAATPAPAKPGIIARITGTAPKPAAPAAGQAPAAAAAPKAAPTTAAAGSKAPTPKTAAATAATGQPADIGDICLLPEIARPAR